MPNMCISTPLSQTLTDFWWLKQTEMWKNFISDNEQDANRHPNQNVLHSNSCFRLLQRSFANQWLVYFHKLWLMLKILVSVLDRGLQSPGKPQTAVAQQCSSPAAGLLLPHTHNTHVLIFPVNNPKTKGGILHACIFVLKLCSPAFSSLSRSKLKHSSLFEVVFNAYRHL